MFGYATDLRSMTQGRATYTMQFKHYAEVPSGIAAEIVAKGQGGLTWLCLPLPSRIVYTASLAVRQASSPRPSTGYHVPLSDHCLRVPG